MIPAHGTRPHLLEMRRVTGGAEPAAAAPRRMQGVSLGVARVPPVRRVRHSRREALPRTHRRGDPRQDAGELLRSLQAEGRRIRRAEHGRGRCLTRRARRAVREEVIAILKITAGALAVCAACALAVVCAGWLAFATSGLISMILLWCLAILL